MGFDGGSGFIPKGSGGGGGGGTVNSVTGNIVDNTDPVNPVVTQQQADWKEINPVAIPFIDNKPYYTTTRANLLTDMAANTLVLDAGYLITDADPTVANSGIIVRATGPGRVSREAVFLANYGGTIYSEFCLYDVTNDKVKERRDIYGNTVIDSTATHGTLQWFPWGNSKVTGNWIKDTTGVVTIGAAEFRNNIIESGQLNITNATSIKNNFITGPCIININAGCTLLGNTINLINTLTLSGTNIMLGSKLQGASVNVTLAANANLYNSNVTGNSNFTVPAGRTLQGDFRNLNDTDLSRYDVLYFNNATYLGNVSSNFAATIDLAGGSTYNEATLNSPGVVIVDNTINEIDNIVLGNITTPVIFKTKSSILFNLNSGGAGQFLTNLKNTDYYGPTFGFDSTLSGSYFIARWNTQLSAWVIETFYL